MDTIASEVVALGEGLFNWPRCERQSDRYGLVTVLSGGDEQLSLADSLVQVQKTILDANTVRDLVLNEARGNLRATVLVGRRSNHIGDLFRALRQRRVPSSGEQVLLAQSAGAIFCDDPYGDGSLYVGIEPDEERSADWLVPEVLYDLHESRVRLEFVPEARRG